MTNYSANGWPLLPIAECMAAIIDYRGKSPAKTKVGIPLVTAKIVKNGRIGTPDEFIAPEDYHSWMRRGLPEPGDVVMTTEAPLGEVGQLDGTKFALAQRLITLRGKSGVLDNTFLKFAMQSEFVQDELRARATGTTVVGIRQSELRKVLLPVPPIDEQQAIAHILGTLDDKIESNRRMNQTLEQIARAIFKSWFVDFDPVRAKADGRQPPGLDPETAALFPDSFTDSPLGPIPVGWRIDTISGVCESVFSGGTPSTNEPSYWNGGVPWLSSGETRDNVIIGTEKTITREGVTNSSTRLARSGSTVIASAGQGHTRGQTSLLLLDSYINQSVVALVANPSLVSPLFLFFDLERRYEEFRQVSDGHSSRGSLTTKLIGELRLVFPTPQLVEAFDGICSPLVAEIAANLRQSRTLAAIRDALLPKLLSGDIRVSDPKRIAEEVS